MRAIAGLKVLDLTLPGERERGQFGQEDPETWRTTIAGALLTPGSVVATFLPNGTVPRGGPP